MNNEDRIKLAMAMGWKEVPELSRVYIVPMGIAPEEAIERELPNPFEDANDDYAVFQWLWRKNLKGWTSHLNNRLYQYHIGDYARAALKVIDDE